INIPLPWRKKIASFCACAGQHSSWMCPTALLSLYGFFANCRPAEPFLTPYLLGHKNISGHVVTNYLFPIWTYSYLAVLPLIFLLTDMLRYKPLVVLQGLFLVSNYLLLCFAFDLVALTYLQFNFAMVTSTEVAYFSYIYSVIPAEQYQRATAYVRSAMLTGFTFGATMGQMLISLADLSYFTVNAITLAFMGIAFLVSFSLPMPRHGMYFGTGPGASTYPLNEVTEATDRMSGREEMKGAVSRWYSKERMRFAARQMWENLRESYSTKRLVYWSLWWALATANYGQVFNYVQVMWDQIAPSSTSSIYNGGVEAVCTLVGSVFLTGLSTNIWLSYTGYVIFKASYMFLITITTFQIAANLSMECYALTFGINTFVALALQTVLTAVVVDHSGLGLDIVTQVSTRFRNKYLIKRGYKCIFCDNDKSRT
uniref:Solute carrier family 19 member 3b n=1 Tax=Electrophorus electricus TaxID=8005 RepID=A0A4W4FQN1_ELEEL